MTKATTDFSGKNLQISQSFKTSRIGESLLLPSASEINTAPSAKLIVALGGNAGLATACAARSLGLLRTVYIPDGISDEMRLRLKQEDAEVIVGEENYLHPLRRAERPSNRIRLRE